jgi:D-cysteine desulfhydrase family pyridoxal phosphate-dependent enzyme
VEITMPAIPEGPPKTRIAHLPTPIEDFSRLRGGLWVKRDDFSGGELSGNKVRKLEYLAAAAIAEGADTLVTAGDVQSNHARATAVVAARLGLRSLLVLEGPADVSEWTRGNAFIDRLVGAEIDWQPDEGLIPQRLAAAADRLRRAGRRPYVIPVGGSNELGAWGYIEAAREAKAQCDAMGLEIDRIVCTAGSCGTLAGLAIGIKLAGWTVRDTGIGISSNADKKAIWAHGLIDRTIAQYNLPVTVAADDLEIHDYAGAGYAKSRPDELAAIRDAARRGGLVLDPVYTGKAFFGLMDLAERGIIKADESVLFFHTGGLLGLLAKADQFQRD